MLLPLPFTLMLDPCTIPLLSLTLLSVIPYTSAFLLAWRRDSVRGLRSVSHDLHHVLYDMCHNPGIPDHIYYVTILLPAYQSEAKVERLSARRSSLT